MIKTSSLIILLLTLLLFTTTCKSDKNEIITLADNFYEEQLIFFPLSATSAGDNRYNDRFPNSLTQSFRNDLKISYQKYLDKLSKIDRNSLNENDQLTYDVLEWECNLSLEDLKFPSELMPINQFWTVNLFIGQLASGSSSQPFKTVADYNNWTKRVDGFITWCDTAILNMTRGIAEGYVLPKSLIEKVIPQIASWKNGPVEEHLFYSPLNTMPESFTEEQKTTIKSSYTKMIEEKVIPTYKRLHTFFEEEYLPAGRLSSGYSDIPNGEQWYNYRMKLYTTTNMTADKVHQLGLSEVERILAEMEEIKEKVGFKGDIKSFFNHVRTSKELMPYSDPQQVLDYYNGIHQKMKPKLALLFDLVPKTPFEVRRTESFREASASAEYNSGSLDGTRPGIFYVPIPDVKKYNNYSGESLFLHEAIPGHHYQISLQQENSALPKFRKILWYSSYGEGWALYSEGLGIELGLYEDSYQYFGMLSAEMHRAIRLVVDTGIHTKGWTREQAIQYSLDHEAEPEEDIIREIERYMAGPAQALSYKIGQLKIRELRRNAVKELGAKFDIKQFHNKVLESGCLPLSVLERKIERWIESQKN